MNFHRIYILSVDGTVRNVGVTKKSENVRLQEHLSEARRGVKNHRCNWLRSLRQPPIVEVIEWVRPEDRNEREKYWIALFRDYGHQLVNNTDGGDGVLGCPLTSETRAKMSLAGKGKPKSPEHRAALAAANRRPEARERVRQQFSGKTLSKEMREKISAAKRGNKNPMFGKSGADSPVFGRKHTPEECARMQEAQQRILRAK